jgi:oligoribonuclease NrnB/cAMP/cGMP phosphodiesterase (DHH superfamily)
MQIKKEKYNIYFHNDFDGYVSCAIIFDFLNKNNAKIQSLNLAYYDYKNKWSNINLKKNAVVLDFLYHPQAYLWFDHHKTTFITKEWEKIFKKKKNKYHYFNINYASCAHLVLDSLKKDFNYKPSKNILNLVYWADIIDRANYKSPLQTIELKDPALQIDAYIDNYKGKKPLKWLIKDLSKKSLKETASNIKIQKLVKKEKEKINKLLKFYYKNLKIYYDKIGFIDISAKHNKNGYLRYIPFYLAPQIIYNITLKKIDSFYALSLGANPWKRNKNKINIGEFLRKNFGGGGHKNVGGAEFKNKKTALKAIEKIINFFNQQHE